MRPARRNWYGHGSMVTGRSPWGRSWIAGIARNNRRALRDPEGLAAFPFDGLGFGLAVLGRLVGTRAGRLIRDGLRVCHAAAWSAIGNGTACGRPSRMWA